MCIQKRILHIYRVCRNLIFTCVFKKGFHGLVFGHCRFFCLQFGLVFLLRNFNLLKSHDWVIKVKEKRREDLKITTEEEELLLSRSNLLENFVFIKKSLIFLTTTPGQWYL